MKSNLFPAAAILCVVVGAVLLCNRLAPSPTARTQRIRGVNSLPNATFVLAQAEQVKSKAKDLKKKVETQQTNQVEKPTPPEPKK